MSILISNVLLDNARVDILIEGEKIAEVKAAGEITAPSPQCLDAPDFTHIAADHLAAIPGLVNTHTHAAMTYFRGYGDDLDLMDWLENMIWPVEAHVDAEHIYWSSRLACMEMIATGTTAFLDMYTYPEATAQAVEDAGLRAVLSYTMFDRGSKERAKKDRENCEYYWELFKKYSNRVGFAVGPHAIYTVSAEQLKFAAKFSEEHNCLVHLHLAETYKEWKDCCASFGTTPVRYLKGLGVLSPRLVLAHSLWMDSEEIDMLADYGCSTVHNPASNMKLSSGYKFRFQEMLSKGVKVGIGTDGCSSSNNLDMVQAMKLASLLGKAWTADPKYNSVQTVFNAATKAGASILRLDDRGVVKGATADLCLVNCDLPEMTPNHNFISNLVYSATGTAIDTTIVAGKILMRNREQEEKELVLQKAKEVTEDLFKKAGRQMSEHSNYNNKNSL